MRFAAKRQPESITLDTQEGPVAVAVRRNARARRLILRIDQRTGSPVLVLPERTGIAEGRRFAERHQGWIAERMSRHAGSGAFGDGAVFPLRGVPCRIIWRPGRGSVRLVQGAAAGPTGRAVIVPSAPAELSARLTQWLKRQARADLEAAVRRHAAVLGVCCARLRIGDTTSRWGSCSSNGTLSFSWRLVLAPPNVLSYLAAHEVAHLKEMNHTKRFWQLVERLDPEHRAARQWLKRHGPALHAVSRA